MMEYSRATIVFLLWYYSTLPDFSYGIHRNTSTDLIWEESTNRSSESRRHRLQMFFPLMLGISSRLAALVPTAMMILFGVFVFVAFAKKAFVVSLVALYIVLSRRSNKKTKEEQNDEENEEYETIEEHIHLGRYPEKHYYKKRHYPKKHMYHHKKWKMPLNPLFVFPYVPVPMPVYYPYYLPNYHYMNHPHLLKG